MRAEEDAIFRTIPQFSKKPATFYPPQHPIANFSSGIPIRWSLPKTDLIDEAQLIARVCEGDREAFYALVQPCERGIFAAAMSILNNPADAEEAAQEAVLKAFAAISRFRGEAKFSTWLIQITINEARLKLRKDRRHLYESTDEEKTDEQGDYFPEGLCRLARDSL